MAKHNGPPMIASIGNYRLGNGQVIYFMGAWEMKFIPRGSAYPPAPTTGLFVLRGGRG